MFNQYPDVEISKNMRITISIIFILLIHSFANGQRIGTEWYSESTNNGITIQNSYPKGGPYPGPTSKHYNYSYLVFFSRVINETENPLELKIDFSADSIAIPNSPYTYVKLFLPQDTMTMAKESLFSYGITAIESFDNPTRFQRNLNPGEDCLFYTVAIFYQTNPDAWNQKRGGNRAELILNGDNLYYNLPPQIDSLHCGHLRFSK
jgi:hypothetical protein